MPNNDHHLNANHHHTPPSNTDEQRTDARIRQLLAGQPVLPAANDTLQRRVFAKVRRRQVAARAAFAASLLMLLSVGWLLRSEQQLPNEFQNSPRLDWVVQEKKPAGSANASEGFAAFASVYQGDFSPVAQLETLDNEPRALLRYLDSLAATREQE